MKDIFNSSFMKSSLSRGKERREAKRISYICEVHCEGSGMRSLTTRINDLSVTGVFIDSMSPYPVGSIMKLKFAVMDVPIEVQGEVRYVMPQVGMGVRFLDLKPEHLALIECVVEGKPIDDALSALSDPARSALPPAPAQAEPPAPLEPPQPAAMPAKDQNVLMGNFAIMSLFDVIQMIENSRQTGALVIASPGVNGEIHFNEGQIVGAQSEMNVSVDALSLFLDVTEGMFQFRKSEAEFPLTIQATSNMGLLMDLLRIKDEENMLIDG